MRRFVILTILWVTSVTAQIHTDIRSVLVLGDSHLKGYFGEFFHKHLHSQRNYFILSVAIGGAGSKTFIGPLKNTCCGYRVRYTAPDSKLNDHDWIPVMEGAEQPTDGNILKIYGSDIPGILRLFRPDVVIIALGSNYYNAHQDLLDMIDAYKWQLPVIWIGPFNRINVEIRYDAIKKVMTNKPNSLLIRSDDIVGNDTIGQTHFVGRTARYWAHMVVERALPFLDSVLVKNKQ